MLELHSKQSEASARTAKRMNAGQGSGPAVRVDWPYVGHHSKRQSCVVALRGETARKACKKQKGVPGKPSRYATVAGPGTQPAGWAGDRRRNADRGRRANVEDTSKSCGPGVVEQLGVLEMHLRQDRSEG